jgi:hypothetical protein
VKHAIPAGAATAFDELLTERLRVLGADHPDTLATRRDLVYWRREAADPSDAATAQPAAAPPFSLRIHKFVSDVDKY